VKVEIYTDGACSGNPGPGGWGALLRFGTEEKSMQGGVLNTTNNRMEMQAAIEALKALKIPSEVALYTDSKYLCDGMAKWLNNWKKNAWKTAQKQPVKNMDLWLELDNLALQHNISWHWVKGHSGHQENDYVDALAQAAIQTLLAKS
jgi:ribonuclease HI